MKKKNEKTQKPMGFFNLGFFEKTHWVQSDRTQSGPPCFLVKESYGNKYGMRHFLCFGILQRS